MLINGYKMEIVCANFDTKINCYGDIYNNVEDCIRDHPSDKILFGYHLTGKTETPDWFDSLSDAVNWAWTHVKDDSHIKQGSRVMVCGDSAELWIRDYNVRVLSEATVEETPSKNAKKVLLTIDRIDGDSNVSCYVRRSKIRSI